MNFYITLFKFLDMICICTILKARLHESNMVWAWKEIPCMGLPARTNVSSCHKSWILYKIVVCGNFLILIVENRFLRWINIIQGYPTQEERFSTIKNKKLWTKQNSIEFMFFDTWDPQYPGYWSGTLSFHATWGAYRMININDLIKNYTNLDRLYVHLNHDSESTLPTSRIGGACHTELIFLIWGEPIALLSTSNLKSISQLIYTIPKNALQITTIDD